MAAADSRHDIHRIFLGSSWTAASRIKCVYCVTRVPAVQPAVHQHNGVNERQSTGRLRTCPLDSRNNAFLLPRVCTLAELNSRFFDDCFLLATSTSGNPQKCIYRVCSYDFHIELLLDSLSLLRTFPL